MGLPHGYRYKKNMAIYSTEDSRTSYIKNYCTDEDGNKTKDLENHYDHADKFNREDRIFCLDCPDFEVCKGRFWQGCHNRSIAMRIIRGEV